MVKKKYVVDFLVWERIEQVIETDEPDETKIKKLAIELASKEQSKVSWQVDNSFADSDVNIREIEYIEDTFNPNEVKRNED